MKEVVNSRLQALLKYLEVAVLYFTLVLLKSPIGISSALLVFALAILYRHRKELIAGQDLKQVLYLFLIYIVTFTVVSDYHHDSVKGLYDIIRSLFLFWVGFLLLELAEKYRLNTIVLIVTLVLLLGNFFFPHYSSYFGYNENPNNVAVQVFLQMMVGLLFVQWTRMNMVIGGLVLLTGLILLVLANSRGIILGGAIASVFFVVGYIRKTLLKITFIAVLGSLFASYFLFFNNKGLGLSNRDQIWPPLLEYIANHEFWLGTGLNSVKPVLAALNVNFLTAHNLFLEIFTTTGFIGLVFFCFILYFLVRVLLKQEYRQSISRDVAIFALMVLFVAFQFDLKFTAFSFMGMIMALLGTIYHESVSRPMPGKKPNEC